MDMKTNFHAIATKVKNHTKICFRVARVLGHEIKFIFSQVSFAV